MSSSVPAGQAGAKLPPPPAANLSENFLRVRIFWLQAFGAETSHYAEFVGKIESLNTHVLCRLSVI